MTWKDFSYAMSVASCTPTRIVGVMPVTNSIAVVLPVATAVNKSTRDVLGKPALIAAGAIYLGRFVNLLSS